MGRFKRLFNSASSEDECDPVPTPPPEDETREFPLSVLLLYAFIITTRIVIVGLSINLLKEHLRYGPLDGIGSVALALGIGALTAVYYGISTCTGRHIPYFKTVTALLWIGACIWLALGVQLYEPYTQKIVSAYNRVKDTPDVQSNPKLLLALKALALMVAQLPNDRVKSIVLAILTGLEAITMLVLEVILWHESRKKNSVVFDIVQIANLP